MKRNNQAPWDIVLSTGYKSPSQLDVEIVERKGLGHPDTIADTLAEEFTISYSRYCLKHYGAILHHHVDKVYVRGGRWLISGDKITMEKPISVFVNGRFSYEFAGSLIPVYELFLGVTAEVLRNLIPTLKEIEEDWFSLHVANNFGSHTPKWYSPTTLDDLPDKDNAWSGDTSVVCSFRGYTAAEKLTLALERALYKEMGCPIFPYLGFDIKFMVVRCGNKYHITCCLPILAKYAKGLDEYYALQEEVREYLLKVAIKELGVRSIVEISSNTQDHNLFRNHKYISALGSCLDTGEEGMVGRGNRASGFISSFRPFSMEAPYGKNPMYHSGRVLSYVSDRLAASLNEFLEDDDVVVSMISQNGGGLLPPFCTCVYTGGVVTKDLVIELLQPLLNRDEIVTQLLDGYLTPTRALFQSDGL